MSSSPSTTELVVGESVFLYRFHNTTRFSQKHVVLRVTEVGEDYVVLSSGQTFYLWEKIRNKTGALPHNWDLFEDWCGRVNVLDRLAIETEDE